MSLRHPAAPLRPSRLLTIYAGKLTTISPPHPINTCTYMYVNQYVLDSMYTCLYISICRVCSVVSAVRGARALVCACVLHSLMSDKVLAGPRLWVGAAFVSK